MATKKIKYQDIIADKKENKIKWLEWFHNCKEIDSSLGYIATDVDSCWYNYRKDLLMLFEVKCLMAVPDYPQKSILKKLHVMLKKSKDKSYLGYFLIQFENLFPYDGKIFINKKEISYADFILFLQFDAEIIAKYNCLKKY